LALSVELLARALAPMVERTVNMDAVMTPSDEWLAVLVAIQVAVCPYKENPVDRAFIRDMINQLTLDDPPQLTWRQRRWIETLKKECKQ
jgi:hypothetical protein